VKTDYPARHSDQYTKNGKIIRDLIEQASVNKDREPIAFCRDLEFWTLP